MGQKATVGGPLPTAPGSLPCTCWFPIEGPRVRPASQEQAALLRRSLGVVSRAAWGWAHHVAVHRREHCLTVLLLGVRAAGQLLDPDGHSHCLGTRLWGGRGGSSRRVWSRHPGVCEVPTHLPQPSGQGCSEWTAR